MKILFENVACMWGVQYSEFFLNFLVQVCVRKGPFYFQVFAFLPAQSSNEGVVNVCVIDWTEVRSHCAWIRSNGRCSEDVLEFRWKFDRLRSLLRSRSLLVERCVTWFTSLLWQNVSDRGPSSAAKCKDRLIAQNSTARAIMMMT